MKNKALFIVLYFILQATSAVAGWNIQSNKTYYLCCDYAEGFVGLSSEQGQSGYVLYQQTTGSPTADAYWQIIPSGNGYAFKNAYSGQYLSWSDDYNGLRNLDLADDLMGDDQRWEIVAREDGNGVNIRSLSHSTYFFHMRTSYLVALYGTAGAENDTRSIFHIYDNNGDEIVYNEDTADEDALWDPAKRYNIKSPNGFGYLVYDPAASEDYPSLQGYEGVDASHPASNPLYLEPADLGSENTQWTITRDADGYYYLYNIGRMAYISNRRNISNFQFVSDAQPMEVTDLGDGSYAFRMAAHIGDNTAYMCAASQYDMLSRPPITNWEMYDVGCAWVVSEATEFSPGGSTDEVTVDGYNSTVQWDGVGDTHTFPNWTSSNAEAANTTSTYTVEFTAQGVYRISFNWNFSPNTSTSEFVATLDDEEIVPVQGFFASDNYNEEHRLDAGTHTLKFTYSKGVDEYTYGNYSDNVTVRRLTFTHVPKVESISLEAEKTLLEPGDVVQILATVSPENAENRTLTWSTDNGDFPVAQDGTVTVNDYGTATITATAQDGSGVSASITLRAVDAYKPYGEDMIYLRHRDSTVTVLPRDLVESCTYGGSLFTATLVNQKIVQQTGIVDTSHVAPADLPAFQTYKFNNKFNPQVFTDAETTTPQASVINLDVAGIGKWLTASFKLADHATQVYVGAVRQRSKETRQSFAQPVVYRFTNPKWSIIRLRLQEDGVTYAPETSPYERKQSVAVRFLTDHSTNEYTVPRIDITLTDNTGPWGYNNWIGMNGKKTYMPATIAISGGGVFPDMATTPIQIKGRGNSSWSGSYYSKNPYHFKFAVKQKPLGMTAGKHWILLANKQSGSMTTNAMGMKAANIFEAAGNNHIVPVELYINGSYRGSYNLTERVGFSNNSIDLADESCAAMMELDTYGDEPIYTSNAYGISTKIHIPDADDIAETNLTNRLIIEDYDRMTEILAQGDDEYTKVVDAEYLARYLSACELIYNFEMQHPKSIFLYSENVTDELDAEGRDATPWIFGPLWDCDWAFGYEGSHQYYVNNAERDLFEALQSYSTGAFWNDLRYNSQEVDSIYYQLWYDLKQRNIVQELYDYAQEYYDFAKKSFEHNTQNECSESDGRDYATVTRISQNWITTRFEYVFNSLTPYDLPETDPDDPNNPGRDLMGDLNDDGYITAADVVTMLNAILNLPNETYYPGRADIDSDGEVSIGDVVMLCNLIMEQTSSVRRQLHLPAATMHICAASAVLPTHSEGIAHLIVEADEGQYSALQMDIELPRGVELNGVVLPAALNGMTARTRLLDNGSYRVVLYADGSFALPTTPVAIGLRLITGDAVEGRISIKAPTAGTSLGEEERMPAHSAKLSVQEGATGVQQPQAADDEKQKLYDLSGRRLLQPTKGVFIRNGKKYVR